MSPRNTAVYVLFNHFFIKRKRIMKLLHQFIRLLTEPAIPHLHTDMPFTFNCKDLEPFHSFSSREKAIARDSALRTSSNRSPKLKAIASITIPPPVTAILR